MSLSLSLSDGLLCLFFAGTDGSSDASDAEVESCVVSPPLSVTVSAITFLIVVTLRGFLPQSSTSVLAAAGFHRPGALITRGDTEHRPQIAYCHRSCVWLTAVDQHGQCFSFLVFPHHRQPAEVLHFYVKPTSVHTKQRRVRYARANGNIVISCLRDVRLMLPRSMSYKFLLNEYMRFLNSPHVQNSCSVTTIVTAFPKNPFNGFPRCLKGSLNQLS